MMKLTALHVLCCAVLVSANQVFLPDGALLAIQNGGIQLLSSEIQQENKELEDAIAAFKPVNASCMIKYNAALSACQSCVETKCRKRAESVCRPEQWQVILGKTFNFFKSGIPNFFRKSIPGVFVDKIGGGVVDIATNIGDKLVDFGKKIGSGVVGAGKTFVDFGAGLGKGAVDAAKKFGGVVVNAGKTIADGFDAALNGAKKIGEKIGNLGSAIGDAFKNLIGKRSLKELVKRGAEPDCNRFENDATGACQFYLQPSYCASCAFSMEAKCAGYKTALDRIKAANNKRKWMTKVANQNYNVIELSFDHTKLDFSSGDFKGVFVKVEIFGRVLSFTVNEPINPYLAHLAAPKIARQALELFKTS